MKAPSRTTMNEEITESWGLQLFKKKEEKFFFHVCLRVTIKYKLIKCVSFLSETHRGWVGWGIKEPFGKMSNFVLWTNKGFHNLFLKGLSKTTPLVKFSTNFPRNTWSFNNSSHSKSEWAFVDITFNHSKAGDEINVSQLYDPINQFVRI